MVIYLYQPLWAVDEESGLVTVSALDAAPPDDPDPAGWTPTQRVTMHLQTVDMTTTALEQVDRDDGALPG